jgi:glycogen synthase
MGLQVIPVLHNTLWPAGYAPSSLARRAILKLDRFFWSKVPLAVLVVSPECGRQAIQMGTTAPIVQFLPQFNAEPFRRIPPPTSPLARPFRVMFVGRITRDKGVFDILEAARLLEARRPGQTHWEICGDGPDLMDLRLIAESKGLRQIVTFHGYQSSADQADVYATAHVSIVPTRSTFNEGLSMTAIEAVLAGRPVITNRVVPALELIRPGAVEAEPDDPESYVNAIEMLMIDAVTYNRKVQATHGLAEHFLDRRFGLAAGLGAVFNNVPSAKDDASVSERVGQ